MSVKHKVLLQATCKNLDICYRRVQHTNELVINGNVYAEKPGVIEINHVLYAEIGGHVVTAGLERANCGNGGWYGQTAKGETLYLGGKAFLGSVCGKLGCGGTALEGRNAYHYRELYRRPRGKGRAHSTE